MFGIDRAIGEEGFEPVGGFGLFLGTACGAFSGSEEFVGGEENGVFLETASWLVGCAVIGGDGGI